MNILFSYLSCYEKKLEGQCRATAHISPDRNDDRLTLSKQHFHPAREFNLNVPLLRLEITERALEKTINSYTPRGIYMQAIAKLVPTYKLFFCLFCKQQYTLYIRYVTMHRWWLVLISLFTWVWYNVWISFPEAAENYTFLQSVERMRRLRRKFFPQTPRNMANLHDLLTAADNEHFAMTLQNPPNRLKYINFSHLLPKSI